MTELDTTDRDILMILQKGVPLTSTPYLDIATQVGGITEQEVIDRINRMKETNIIRRMSGFFNSQKLGYVSTLVAAKPKPGKFDEAVAAINKYPGVTHNYQRNFEYSIWFTLITINRPTMDAILEELSNNDAIEELASLNMERRYKINVTFDVTKEGANRG